MFRSRSTHSTSEQTPSHIYCVPLNGANEAVTWAMEVNDLGVVKRFNCSVSSSARFTAADRCSSALWAVSEAVDDTSCALAASDSAWASSRCAFCAFRRASLASSLAAFAMPITALASSCAILADVAASPASLWASASRMLLNSWSWLSILDTRTSQIPSPPTPTTIQIQPNLTSFFVHRYFVMGSSGSKPCTDDINSSASSSTTPSATITVTNMSNAKNVWRSASRSLLNNASRVGVIEGSEGNDSETTSVVVGACCWIVLGAVWAMSKIMALVTGVYHRVVIGTARTARESLPIR